MINRTPEQIREITRCLLDPEYFVDTFCWLQQKASAGVSESSAIIPFVMGREPGEVHFFQRQILRALKNRDNVVTMKSRRVGCSWVAAAFAAWRINFYESVNILFVSENGLKAEQILEKVKFILKNLAYHDHENLRKATQAPWLRSESMVDNVKKFNIVWRNDDGSIRATSDVLSLNNTDNTGAGDDATFILFDELDLYEHPDETWASAMPTLTLGGHWMAVSTPREIGSVFHRLVSAGQLDKLGKLDEPIDFEYLEIRKEDAGITDEQVRKVTAGWTQEKIDREYNLTFTSPGTVAFNPTHLAVCYRPLTDPRNKDLEEFLAGYDEKVKKEGNAEFMYYSGADTSEAKVYRKRSQKDYHAFCALTANGVQAGAYHSKEALSKWAGQVIEDGTGNDVRVVGTLSKLHAEYPGILYVETNGPGLTAAANHILPKDVFSEMVQVGMNHYFKRGIVERFILKIENHLITIIDPFTYYCMSMFQNLGHNKYGAPEGYYDDPVIAMLLASASMDAHGMMDIEWGRKVTDRKSVVNEADELFTSGPAVQLAVPAEAMRTSEGILGGLLHNPLDDTDVFQWMITEDNNTFDRIVGGNHATMF